MSVEVEELKEALEQLVFKEPHFLNRIIRTSLDNVATKEDLKLLFELINNRFEDVNNRFEDVNRRFEDMNRRFEDMNRRFEDMNRRFEEIHKYMEKRFEDMQKYMDRRFNFITRLIVVFNIPLLLTMIGLLLDLLLKK